MQENQELINSLIEKQKTSAYSQQVAVDQEENQLLVSRVVTAKYKVYVAILVILGVLLGTTYVPNAMSHYQSVVGELNSKKTTLANLKNQFQEYTVERAKLDSILLNEQVIINCVNEKECENIPDLLSGNMPMVISFIQMGDLSSEKMGIDEEKIIKNLDKYLVKNEPGEITSSTNGTIQRIEMGEQEIVKEMEIEVVGENGEKRKQQLHFIKIPVNVEITFNQKDDLITFVDNIENYIIKNEEDRILYVIDEVSYDIMAYDEEQSTEIALSAYYFK